MEDYTGHVEPDGDWQDRVDGHLFVRKLSVEEMDNNCYVIACTRTQEALLVDVAARPERLRQALEGFTPLAAVQTHGHWDHVRAWDGIRDDAGIEVWGHPGDGELFPHAVDRELAGGETLTVGDLEVEVLHLPGHTEGSLLYLVHGESRPHLFSGDTLFPGGPGNTFGNADNHRRILDGLEELVFGRLPDETWVYPGHGDDTTLGAERPSLQEWRERGW
ncbi:MBL fold metallo-hydrolase [Egicoccus halophilus]|uniref:Zn-dependent hydrolase n=1 Tax=Egicoccus halophilus TaxID=1670830 RepID=A0A8J3ESY6_9ACTN|nr:MBL fold metallo-hydrolase [Egicoccus halophilus]GGI04485.1 Zn-dependent hydrolase [Egicoccus halophilus]